MDRVLGKGVVEIKTPFLQLKGEKKRSEQDSPCCNGGRCPRRRWRRFSTQSSVCLTCSWPLDGAPSIDSYTDALANVGNSKIQYTKPTTISCLVGPRQSLAKERSASRRSEVLWCPIHVYQHDPPSQSNLPGLP